VQDLSAFLKELGIKTDFLAEGSSTRSILDDVIAAKYFKGTPVPSAATHASYLLALTKLENEISMSTHVGDKLQKGFWIQELHSLRTTSNQMWRSSQAKGDAAQWDIGEEREGQGAENMLWLANERYRGHKIIVWAATFHIFRNEGLEPSQCADAKDVGFCQHVSMGQRVREKLGRGVYTIGFTAYGGNTGFVVDGKPAESWTGPLKKDQDPSIEMEELLNAADFNYAFLDLASPRKGSEWLKTPIRSRLMGNAAALRKWPDALDAIFFIREQQFDTRKAF
jgi:erythromycin esterase-like protein